MKNLLRKTICLLIAFMMIIPAIPGSYADAKEAEEVTEVYTADEVYEKNIHFTSTNKQSSLQGFWRNGNKVYFAVTIQHAKSIESASYITSEQTETVSGSAIKYLEGVTKVEVEVDGDTELELSLPKSNQKFVIITFKNIEIEDNFDFEIDIDHGNGHEFDNDSVELVEDEIEDDKDEEEQKEDEHKEEEPGGSGEQPGGQQPGGEQPGGEQPGGEQPGGEQPGGEQPGGEQPGGEQPGGEQPGGEQPGGEQPGGEQPGGEQPGGEQPGGEQPGGEQPGGEQPGGEQPKLDEKPSNNNDRGRSGGGTTINEMIVPLAELEKTDHFAYVIGYPEGTIKPLNKITRQEVAMIFFRLLKDDSRTTLLSETNTFSDADSQLWSNMAISTLHNANIITGYPDGTFRPEAPITRAEFATIAAKFDNLELGNTSKFTDITGHCAEDYITSSEIKGWIKGYPDMTFKPDEDITRAEAMTLINNVLGRLVPVENIHPDAIAWSDIKETDWFYTIIMEASNSHDYVTEEDGDELWTGLKANKVWP